MPHLGGGVNLRKLCTCTHVGVYAHVHANIPHIKGAPKSSEKYREGSFLAGT